MSPSGNVKASSPAPWAASSALATSLHGFAMAAEPFDAVSLEALACDELAELSVLAELELVGCDEHPAIPTIEQASKADAMNLTSLFDVVFMM